MTVGGMPAARRVAVPGATLGVEKVIQPRDP